MTTAEQPLVAIILVNFNSYEDTKLALESLRKLTYRNANAILVHNACTDDSPERLSREFPEVRHEISKKNLGFSGGNNLGIKIAFNELAAQHILLLNNDTEATPGFIEPLLARLDSDPTIACACSKIYYGPRVMDGRSNVIWFAGSFQKWHTGFHHIGVLQEDDGSFDVAKPVIFASGCALLMRGSAVRELGGLCDDLFLYWEETDWCYRAREHGYSAWYEPKSVIYHNFKSAQHGKERPMYMYMQTRNAFIFARYHYRGWMSLKYWTLYPIYLAYRFFSLRRMHNPRGAQAIWWAVVDALKGYTSTTGLRERGFVVD